MLGGAGHSIPCSFQSLAGELQGMAEMPSAIPPRSGNISVDKDEVQYRNLAGWNDFRNIT